MQKAEYALEEPVAKSPTHQFVPSVPRAQTVPVSKTEGLTSYFNHIRLLKDPYSQLFEIMKAPEVVVALEKADFHAGVHQIHQRGKHTHIALRDHIMVLVPEIPDVAKQVQGLRPVLRDGSQETDETSLAVCRIIHIQSEVDIRHKVRKRSVSHGSL